MWLVHTNACHNSFPWYSKRWKRGQWENGNNGNIHSKKMHVGRTLPLSSTLQGVSRILQICPCCLYPDACYSLEPMGLMVSGWLCCTDSISPWKNSDTTPSWLVHTLFPLSFRMKAFTFVDLKPGWCETQGADWAGEVLSLFWGTWTRKDVVRLKLL